MSYRFSYLMQRIFKNGGIQNIILTGDKELNILIYTLWGIKKHSKMCFAITFVKLDGF